LYFTSDESSQIANEIKATLCSRLNSGMSMVEVLKVAKKIVVLYACHMGGWEDDYLKQDLFPLTHFDHYNVSTYDSYSNSSNSSLPTPRVLVYNIEIPAVTVATRVSVNWYGSTE
jgi:hypothetical protein